MPKLAIQIFFSKPNFILLDVRYDPSKLFDVSHIRKLELVNFTTAL